ncbi:MAG: hypothetical protein ACR2RF_12455 [Geminicoccaceae bacterium]
MSKSEKTIYLNVGVWYDPDGDKIHLATKDAGGLISTINADPDSKRGHPNLFMKLARCLRDARVPHPAIEATNDAQRPQGSHQARHNGRLDRLSHRH